MRPVTGHGELQFQSTLSVRRATNVNKYGRMTDIISIHALRKESDLQENSQYEDVKISIHALRKESDVTSCPTMHVLLYFNPRSP